MASFRASQYETVNWEGMEVVPGSEFAGLQVAPDPRYGNEKEVNKDVEGLEKEVNKDAEGLEKSPKWLDGDEGINRDNPRTRSRTLSAPAAGSLARRKFRWIIAFILALMVILAAILGGVLGSKAHSASDSALPPVPTSSSSSSGVPSNVTSSNETERSSMGTWKGTSITTTTVPFGQSSGLTHGCWFQDYAGRLHAIYFGDDPFSSFTAVSLNLSATNSSGISSSAWSETTQYDGVVQIVFVAPNGTVVDIIISGSPHEPFQPGCLSRIGITAPTDARTALFMAKSPGAATDMATLFVGETDGRIHTYVYNHTSSTWLSERSDAIEDSWAHGSVFVTDGPVSELGNSTEQSDTFQRSLFMTNVNGSITQFTQVLNSSSLILPNGSFGGQSGLTWGPWSIANVSHSRIRSNASLSGGAKYQIESDLATSEYTMVTEYLWLTNANDSLTAQQVVNMTSVEGSSEPLALSSTFGFGPQISDFDPYYVMPGSDLAFETDLYSLDSNILFYQDEGSSLAWLQLGNRESDTNTSIAFTHVTALGHVVANGTDGSGDTVWKVVT